MVRTREDGHLIAKGAEKCSMGTSRRGCGMGRTMDNYQLHLLGVLTDVMGVAAFAAG